MGRLPRQRIRDCRPAEKPDYGVEYEEEGRQQVAEELEWPV
jgi:hypothetical protein